ncbi:ACP S-malonyltransferase [Kitasatospora kazusensis]|uniref:[acyl-carrier-protein] S-malonyltransferase n=1 Tax=Kitasatospora kazusensis TaxID=407974 RepID=A0ABN2ZZB5_9ACTN
MKLCNSLSHASSSPSLRERSPRKERGQEQPGQEQSGRVDLAADGFRPEAEADRLVGFFPGLGSRAAYQGVGRALLDSGFPAVAEVYREGARALGFPGRPEKLLLLPENMPEGRAARQGFVGAAFLVHNLALEAHLRAVAQERGVPLGFVAYTGESFGVIAAAVAGGALSVGDGVKIAQAFTPLVMLAAEGGDGDDPFAREIARYLPDDLKAGKLVPEPCHVVALRGEPEDLGEILAELGRVFPVADVEVHKTYSRRQTNVYVRVGAKPGFDLFTDGFPAVVAEELKAPTTFLAHSARMREVRRSLERFVEEQRIVFGPPRTPVVSNNDAGLLTTAAQVRSGVLAITDEVMASRATAQALDGLRPDLVLELGLGGKSVQLLADNGVEAPVTAYTGTAEEADQLLRAVRLVGELKGGLAKLRASGDRLEDRHHGLLRSLFRLASESGFGGRYLYRTMRRVITDEMLGSERVGSPAFYQFLETFQHTYTHRDDIDIAEGELVQRARLKKRTTGRPESLGQVYAELRVIDGAGGAVDRISADTGQAEVVVFHFDRPADTGHAGPAGGRRLPPDTPPAARRIHDRLLESLRTEDGVLPAGPGDGAAERAAVSRITYQYGLFQLLRHYRPAVFAQSDHYLEGSDPLGWLVALAASGAVPLPAVVEFHRARLRAGAGTGAADRALERMLSLLGDSEVPVVSPEGIPLRSRKDLEAATRAVLCDGALDAPVRRIHLNGNCQVLSLGSVLDPARVDAGPHRTDVVCVLSPAELWHKRLNPALDAFEDRSVLALTAENERVLRLARSRRILSSMVNAYVSIGEAIVGFGNGGSESMTVFLRKEGEERITVRKILSEALTTARWNPQGEGVMLPPFAKAKKQAEYLQALPESVRRNFPEVYEVLERDVPIPPHLREDGRTGYREVIYEMSYVEGEEVSRFIEKHSPPPAVVARLYEQIFRVLNRNVHSVDRVPAPGGTLEASYFRKIEDRLALSRSTAPHTFGPELTGTERIVVDGVRYLNAPALLKRFRERPEFLEILEPRVHALVMGDTNTENIKMADTGPLLRAQQLIEAGAPRQRIDAALAAITPESLGINFLDPRAIGFRSDGGDTRDDPMYDNKPWHNSVGHYDEIHYEQFKLRVRTGPGLTPAVDVEFDEGNPYRKAYRVRDVEARGGKVDRAAAPQGMEDYFAPVMTAVYGLDDPKSRYLEDDPYWLIRFVFMMGTHFTAMPPFHFQAELDGTLTDTYRTQRRPVAIYCEGVKWLNWALELLEGKRTEFLGLPVPALPHLAQVPPQRATERGPAAGPGGAGAPAGGSPAGRDAARRLVEA